MTAEETSLHREEDFNQLPETYVIFITERDVMGRGLPLYKIERSILGTGELFDDGAHILYVNGAYRGDTPVGRLMHDFFCTRAEDMYYDVLAEKVRYFKDMKEGSDIMCRAMEEMREKAWQEGRLEGRQEGRQEGRREGRQEGRLEEKRSLVQKLLDFDGLTLADISRLSDLPLEEVRRLRDAMPQ